MGLGSNQVTRQAVMVESEARAELADAIGQAPAVPIKRIVSGARLPALILLFTLLTALGAKAAVPIGPVPMTLQTLFVLLAGVVLGPVAGAMSQLLYLGLGVVGAPVFTFGGTGLAWVFGPTGGFLLAFPLAAAVAGWFAGKDRALLRTATGLVVASLLIFALGAGWLGAITDWSSERIWMTAVQPFLVGAVLKASIALVLTRLFVARGLGR